MITRMLCFGDSLTAGYGVSYQDVWHQQLCKNSYIKVINAGMNGSTLTGMQIRLENEVIRQSKDMVLFMGGTNDLISGRSYPDVHDDIAKIFNKILLDQPNSFLIVPPPVIPEMAQRSWDSLADYNQCNQHLRRLGTELEVLFGSRLLSVYQAFSMLDQAERAKLYLDGVHLNEQGHLYFAEFLDKNRIFGTI